MMSLNSVALGIRGGPVDLGLRCTPSFGRLQSCFRPRTSCCLASTAPSSLGVTLQEVTLVKPACTPNGGDGPSSYFLSSLDLFMQPLLVKLVYFFAAPVPHHADPVPILVEALQKVLVHYYPLAGRLHLDSHGRPSINCNAQGVAFAHAHADAELALHLPNLDIGTPLIYSSHSTTSPPLLTAQVTRFKCGGFTLGLVFSHGVVDGTGLANFLTSWAETARGVPLSLPPALDRTFLKARVPLQINYNHAESSAKLEALSFPSTNLTAPSNPVLRSYRFTPANLTTLRKRALEDGVLQNCTSFEALAGLLWKARITALDTKADEKVEIIVPFDGRFVRNAGIPRGYFGNAATISGASASAGEIKEDPLSHAVKHVQRAIKRVTGDFIRSHIDYIEREGVQFCPSASSYSITNWSTLLANGIDFGWGKPIQLRPASTRAQQATVVLPDGEGGGKGMNVIICHSPKVLERMDELLYPHMDPLTSLVSH